MINLLELPYETSDEMDELRKIKEQLSRERLARTEEEEEEYMRKLMEEVRPLLPTATFTWEQNKSDNDQRQSANTTETAMCPQAAF